MSPSTINPIAAVQHIARGGKFTDIRDKVGLDTDCRDSRREWQCTLNGAYLYALCADASHAAELELLANHVDKLINDYWANKESGESENKSGA